VIPNTPSDPMSRKQFILSHGATCKNWQNSWSFVNHDKRFVIFGEWQNRNKGLIFSKDWKAKKKTGRANHGFGESRENIRLVEEEGYKLFVFPMFALDPEAETPKIHLIEERLFERTLQCRDNRHWYALGDAIPAEVIRSTWILQGNPKLFDIDDYLARYPLIYWRTPTHKDKIRLGDRVYMWRAGPDAGVIASGHVVELPTTGDKLKHPDALGADLWMAEKQVERRNDPEVPKVGVSIDAVRLTPEEGMIPRSKFLADPLLSRARVIKLANGTVFPVKPEEAVKIQELWGGGSFTSVDPIETSALEGDKKLASHRKRERSRFLVAKKMQLARSQGPIRCEVCLLPEDGVYPPILASRVFEVHHLKPLSDSDSIVRTTLNDLAIVCANCHRAIHATGNAEENLKTLRKALFKSNSP
jgi:predicted HNH restriction endonuclease